MNAILNGKDGQSLSRDFDFNRNISSCMNTKKIIAFKNLLSPSKNESKGSNYINVADM